MSIRSWGGFIMNDGISDLSKVNFSFQVNKIALENKIGIKLGWNVTPDFMEEYKYQKNVLPFELADNPMTNVVEILFSGDGVILKEMGKRVDQGESLDSRIERVSNLIIGIFQLNIIINMILNINSGFGKAQVIETKPIEFKNTLLNMYTHGRTWEPTVKFILSK
jgi:hypothetical protein